MTYGTPIYFAPYFTQRAIGTLDVTEDGIEYLSRVLGVLTLHPSKIKDFTDDLKEFCGDNGTTVDQWIKGVRIEGDKEGNLGEDGLLTYYFLDEPIKLTKILKKTGWLPRELSQGVSISFASFVERLMLKLPSTINSDDG